VPDRLPVATEGYRPLIQRRIVVVVGFMLLLCVCLCYIIVVLPVS
jgi:hypothetical protein